MIWFIDTYARYSGTFLKLGGMSGEISSIETIFIVVNSLKYILLVIRHFKSNESETFLFNLWSMQNKILH